MTTLIDVTGCNCTHCKQQMSLQHAACEHRRRGYSGNTILVSVLNGKAFGGVTSSTCSNCSLLGTPAKPVVHGQLSSVFRLDRMLCNVIHSNSDKCGSCLYTVCDRSYATAVMDRDNRVCFDRRQRRVTPGAVEYMYHLGRRRQDCD